MKLDQSESDSWRRWSPETSSRGNRGTQSWSHRSRSRGLSYGSKYGSEIQDVRDRRVNNRSASPGNEFAAEKYRRDNQHRYLNVEHEREEEEILRDLKRVRYSNPEERRKYSRERLSERHRIDSSGDEKHKFPCYDFAKRSYQKSPARTLDDSNPNDRRSMKNDSRKRVYCGRDSDASYVGNEPLLDTTVPRKSFQQCGQHLCDHNVEFGNALARDGPKWDDRSTVKDACRSAKWRANASKPCYQVENGNSLSWNGPKWGEELDSEDAPNRANKETDNSSSWNGPKWGETTTQISPNSSKWSDDANLIYNKEAANKLPLNAPKWGEETNTKNVPSFLQTKFVADNDIEADNNLSWASPKWVDKTKVKDASELWRPATSKWGSNEECKKNSPWNVPKWGDEAITKDAPTSSNWRSVTKWGEETNTKIVPSSLKTKFVADNNIEADKNLSWASPKCVDKTNVKNASNWGSKAETKKNSSWSGPKWGDEATTRDASGSSKDAPGSSNWRSVTKWGEETNTKNVPSSTKFVADNNIEADHNLSWASLKWVDKTNVKNASNRGSKAEIKKNSSWNGPKLGGEAITKDAPRSFNWRADTNKWGSKVGTNNSFSRNSPKWGDETTTEDAPTSFQWRKQESDVKADIGSSSIGSKWGDQKTTENRSILSPTSGKENSNSLKWNGPKWGEEIISKDASKQACAEADNSLLWNGPKWGEETTIKDVPDSSKWLDDTNKTYKKEADNNLPSNVPKWGQSVADNKGSNVEADNKFSSTGHKWGAKSNVKDASKSWRSTTTKWITGPKCGDETTSKDAPRSSQWRKSSDNESSHVKTDNNLSWNGLGNETTTKNAPSSSQLRKSSDKWGSHVYTNDSSWNVPKLGDHKITENGSRWRTNARVENDNSLKWNGPKWGEEKQACTETHNYLSRNWPKWGEEATTEDHKTTENGSRWRTNARMENNNSLKWNGPKWGEEKHACTETHNNLSRNWPKWGEESTTKDVPNAANWSDDFNPACNKVADTNLLSNAARWGDKTNVKDASKSWRSATSKWGSNERTNNSTSWPKSGDKTTTQDAPSSSQRRSDTDKWGSKVENNCFAWNGPNWADETTTEDALTSAQRRETTDKRRDSNVEIDNGLSWNSPRRRSKKTAKTAPDSCKWSLDDDKQSYNAKMQKFSRNDRQWDTAKSLRRSDGNKSGDKTSNKDLPNPSQQRADGDRKDYDVKASKWAHLSTGEIDSSSWKDPKRGDQIITEVSPGFSKLKSDDRKDCGVKAANHLSKNVLKLVDQTITKDAPNSKDAEEEVYIITETDFISSLNDPKRAYQTTTADSSKSPWSPNSKQKGKGKENINLSEQNQLPPPHEIQNQNLGHSIFTNQLDTIAQLPSNGQGLRSDCNNHQVSGSGKPLSECSATSNTATEVMETENGLDKKEQNTSHFKGKDVDVRTEESSKDNDTGIQMFKSAIAEFAKDILKPFWKEGCLSKEAHKTIVKKTVEKVVVTLQGSSNIPRTPANIDLYMSFSKTKLTSLVLAYLENFGKG